MTPKWRAKLWPIFAPAPFFGGMGVAKIDIFGAVNAE